jgi:hypothetical protein
MKSLKDGEVYIISVNPGVSKSQSLEGLKKYFRVTSFPVRFKAAYHGHYNHFTQTKSEGLFRCFNNELGCHYNTIREGLVEVHNDVFFDKEEDML